MLYFRSKISLLQCIGSHPRSSDLHGGHGVQKSIGSLKIIIPNCSIVGQSKASCKTFAKAVDFHGTNLRKKSRRKLGNQSACSRRGNARMICIPRREGGACQVVILSIPKQTSSLTPRAYRASDVQVRIISF